jgi:release factor glutamine methyltransferase
MNSVDDWLDGARRRGLERLDARLLAGWVLRREPTWVLAHGDHHPAPAEQAAWEAALARRLAGEPLAYIVGNREFHGLSLQVDRRVLVPRPETEGLVDWALELLDGPLDPEGSDGSVRRVVDLGTGSGAIALALKHHRPAIDVAASDASADALDCARANARRLNLPITWRSGSWWQAHGSDRFHLALSNPPYIRPGDPHLAALVHEPASALIGGSDGLDDLRQITRDARTHLEPGGWLLLEHGHDQGPAVAALLTGGGLEAVVTRQDLAGLPRWSGARRAPKRGHA